MTTTALPVPVPEHWPIGTLPDAVEIWDSKRVPINQTQRNQRVGNVPYYGATGQVGWIDEFLFDDELVLLGEDGAPFLDPRKHKAYIISGKSWVNNHAHVLKAKEGMASGFVKYYLDILDYRPFVSGTTRLKLTQAAMRRIPVPLPDPDEQRRIVDAIETQFARLDDAVAALERTRTRLKRYRASVLKSACEGRLVPTEAELARREGRDYEPASLLLERIRSERAASGQGRGRKAKVAAPLHTAMLPPLPEGWAWSGLDGLLSLLRNGVSTRAEAEGTIPILRISAVRPLALDLSERRFVPRAVEDVEGYFVEPRDILFTRYNGNPDLVGVSAIVPEVASPVLHPDKLIRGQFVAVDPDCMAIMLNAGRSRETIRSRVKTTAGQAGISGSDLKTVPVPVPPLDEQLRIVAEVDRRLSVIDQMEATVETSLRRADAMRQAILRKAFSGRLVTATNREAD